MAFPWPRRPSLRSPATQAVVDRSLAGARSLAAFDGALARSHRYRVSGAHSKGGLVERYVTSVLDRVGGGSFVSKVLHKVFPNHFSFLWGEVALYSFVVLVVTGTYLTFFFEGSQQELIYEGSYEPLQGVEVSAAFDSVMRISFDVKGGLLIRQTHHWAALVFIGAAPRCTWAGCSSPGRSAGRGSSTGSSASRSSCSAWRPA